MVFKKIFDSALEDHFLDVTEEKQLLDAIGKLEIPKEYVQDEIETIKIMADMRNVIEKGLQKVSVDINLQKSEDCYFTEECRLLKTKVFRRFSVSGVKYKEIGHKIEKEGRIYLTNKRILLVGGGTSIVKLDKILDITLIVENNIIELVIDNRKNPIIYTLPKTIVFSALLGNILKEFKN
jgi:hypothetical protein